MKIIIFLITLLLSLTLTVSAATKGKVSMEDEIVYEDKKLVLNGQGIRRATVFKVRVYVGGLYVDSKSQKIKTILSAPYPKLIVMSFVRSASKSKLVEGWKKGFAASLDKQEKTKQSISIKQFCELMEDIKKGQEIKIAFLDQGVRLVFNGKDKGLIGDETFSKALLSIWFINARDESLRDGLLGIE